MLTRIQLACMTDKTRTDYYGVAPLNKRPDYSIHATTNKKRRSDLCTVSPRLRDGKEFAGGRHLRRAKALLKARQAAHNGGKLAGSMKG